MEAGTDLAGFLEEILDSTRADLESRKRRLSATELKTGAFRPGGRVFRDALAGPEISVIAEIKRASPSRGPIRPDLDVAEIAASYEAGGAAAVSVLTEEHYFRGSLEDLGQARSACSLPLLRKDFIIDEYQLLEAAGAGADAVLLIVAALDDESLAGLYADAHSLGLECLVEVHDRGEMERALAVEPAIIGINNRNLHSFEVDLETTLNLIEFVSEGAVVVSESGIHSSDDVLALRQAGVDAVLVGEALMRSTVPGEAISGLLP